MRKITTLLTLLVLATTSLFSQVLNGSFEDWGTSTYTFDVSQLGAPFPPETYTYNDIDDWTTTNQITKASLLGGQELVTKSSTNVYHGDFAAKLETKTLSVPFVGSFVVPGIVISGDFEMEIEVLLEIFGGGSGGGFDFYTIPGTGQAINSRPAHLVGYIDYTKAVSDSAWVTSALIRNTGNGRELVAFVQTHITANTSGYEYLELEYEYYSCAMPDTVVTVFSSSNLDMDNQYTGTAGSVLYVDSFGFSGTAADLPPVLRDDNATTAEGFMVVIPVSDNDAYCDGDVIAPAVATGFEPSNGSVVLNANGEFEYTPDASFIGTDQFSYYDCNAEGCDTAVVTVNVTEIPLCIANDITRNLIVNQVDVFSPSTSDCDNSTVDVLSQPANGTVTVTSSGQFEYTPNSGFEGSDEFEYTVCSPYNTTQCDTATVFITIVNSISQIDPALLSVYPNPAQSDLNVALNLNEEAKVALYDLRGQLVYNGTFVNTTVISLSNFPNGLYILRLETNSGVANRKIQIAK
jgi:hypothetical protein